MINKLRKTFALHYVALPTAGNLALGSNTSCTNNIQDATLTKYFTLTVQFCTKTDTTKLSHPTPGFVTQ